MGISRPNMATTNHRYSFGMIVFNGEEFLRQVLDSIYNFAYQIIIVEGADRNSMPFANPDGSSTDHTVDIIKSYPDPDRKIRLIQGNWRNKTEQSNVWIDRASGDFVWQIDDDEIYKKEDLLAIDTLLKTRPETTAVSFHWCHFFGGMDRIRPINKKTPEVWRLFKFKPSYRWHSHRPPDILDDKGKSLRLINPIPASELVDRGIYIYHFSYITDKQVQEKMRYMERVRMYEYHIGMEVHPLWRFYSHIESAALRLPILRPLKNLTDNYFQWWKCRPTAIKRRKQADKAWNYDFYENVWLPWKENPEAIEGRGILSANRGFYSVTEPFKGELPKAILSHPLLTPEKQKKNVREGRLPNFFIVGAARSGTTSLWNYLKQHPKVFMPEDELDKEPAYFSEKGRNLNYEKYLRLFRGADISHERIGEASTAYLTDPSSAQKIYDFLPNAKIIIMLRNPVDRAYSLYQWMVQEGYEYAESFETSLDLENKRIGEKIPNWYEPEYYWNYLYFHSGLFYGQVKRYVELFGDNVCLIKMEDFKQNFLREYDRVCRFLNLKPNSITPKIFNKACPVYSSTIQFILRKISDDLESQNIELRKGNKAGIVARIFLSFMINGTRFYSGKKRLPDPFLSFLTLERIIKLINGRRNPNHNSNKKSQRDILLRAGWKHNESKRLDPHLKKKLTQRYADSIAKLENLIHVKFEEWMI